MVRKMQRPYCSVPYRPNNGFLTIPYLAFLNLIGKQDRKATLQMRKLSLKGLRDLSKVTWDGTETIVPVSLCLGHFFHYVAWPPTKKYTVVHLGGMWISTPFTY